MYLPSPLVPVPSGWQQPSHFLLEEFLLFSPIAMA